MSLSGLFPVPSEQAHCRGGREDSGDAELFDGCAPMRVRRGMIERALESDSRAARDERRVNHVAVTDNPANV